MSLFDKIIYIADYIEEGREALPCKTVREFLKDSISHDSFENLRTLDKAIIMSIDFTEEYILAKGGKMNRRSLNFRESLR